MSKTLKKFLTKPEKISEFFSLITTKRDKECRTSCGFKLLLSLLTKIFPHLGGKPLDVISEIANLVLERYDTLNSLYKKITKLTQRLQFSGQSIPSTSIVHRYIKILLQCNDTKYFLAGIRREFKDHLRRYGPDIPFHRRVEYIHNFLAESGLDLAAPVQDTLPPSSTATRKEAFFPTANAAMGKRAISKEPISPNRVKTTSHKICSICYLRHPEDRCWARGQEWMPRWLRRNVAKYNATHSDTPSETYLNADPPLRGAKILSKFTNSANVSEVEPTIE